MFANQPVYTVPRQGSQSAVPLQASQQQQQPQPAPQQPGQQPNQQFPQHQYPHPSNTPNQGQAKMQMPPPHVQMQQQQQPPHQQQQVQTPNQQSVQPQQQPQQIQQHQQQPQQQQGQSQTTTRQQLGEDDKVFGWIYDLTHGSNAQREQALLELGKKREQYEDLAVIIWESFGVMTCLLQEIINVYPLLNPPQLSSAASNRVCNALALLQCVASHNETRAPFMRAQIPLFLYPFLSTNSKSRAFEYLRLTSLGVIGALVKNDSPEVINFLLTTETIPLCLRIMEYGTELSKTVAIFIVQKILMDDTGLNYVCQTYERFIAVSSVLSFMVTQLIDQPASRLLKHVVRCYLRLSDNPRAREALRQTLPEPLRDATFSHTLRDDVGTKRCLAQLLANLSDTYD